MPPSTPTSIPFLINFHPHCLIVQVSDPAAITVDAILAAALHWTGTTVAVDPSALRLRWITDESMACPRLPGSPPGQWPYGSPQAYVARDWYAAKGGRLASTPIATDAALQEKLRDILNASVIQLYVVARAQRPHQRYISYYQRNVLRVQPEDDSTPTRIAALYEPAFAHAENALRNLQDAKLDGERGDDGAVDSDGEMLDARLFVARLRDALGNLKAGHPEGGAHAEALGTLFQQLFDDPTLKVNINVKSSGVDGEPWSELDIEGRCATAYGIPALYIIGKDKLMSLSASEGEPDVPEGMRAYRDAVVRLEYYSLYEATCCPCLVVETAGATVQLYAAYLADRIYRSRICEFALDGSLPSDEDALKFQVIRRTARMLRELYAEVHTGVSYAVPHLLPSPSLIMPAPLPVRLDFLDRLRPGACSNDVFTGKLELPTRDDGTDSGSKPPVPVPVHIKFVEKYGVDAHRLLAAHKGADGEPRPLAPQLYWAGEVMPGLMMIVMESLPDDAHTVRWYEPEPESGSEESRCLKWRPLHKPASWDELEDVRTAVELLHQHGFVHGDIRPGNVVLRRPASESDVDDGKGKEGSGSGNGAASGATRAYLIDFDWAGKEGEARYPELNAGVKWPRPASELSGQPITKLHDAFMLERLLVLERKHKNRRKHKRDGDVDKRKRKRDHDGTLQVQ